MKKIICLLALTLGLAGISKAAKPDTIPCLELSAKIEPPDMAYFTQYSIELWSETELVSVMSSEKSEVFHFELKKNVQYTILVLNNDSVVKKVFINTKIYRNEKPKGQKMEVVLGFPGREYNCTEEGKSTEGTIDFDYETGFFIYQAD